MIRLHFFTGLMLVVGTAACTSSGTATGPSPTENSVVGTYQLKSINGTNVPVPLFGQCSLNAPQPCSACSASATAGSLTLKSSNGREFSLTLNAEGPCVDPKGASATTTHTYIISAAGNWTLTGNGLTFTSNNMNFSTATISGSTLRSAFSWLNADAGGQPASVTAEFSK